MSTAQQVEPEVGRRRAPGPAVTTPLRGDAPAGRHRADIQADAEPDVHTGIETGALTPSLDLAPTEPGPVPTDEPSPALSPRGLPLYRRHVASPDPDADLSEPHLPGCGDCLAYLSLWAHHETTRHLIGPDGMLTRDQAYAAFAVFLTDLGAEFEQRLTDPFEVARTERRAAASERQHLDQQQARSLERDPVAQLRGQIAATVEGCNRACFRSGFYPALDAAARAFGATPGVPPQKPVLPLLSVASWAAGPPPCPRAVLIPNPPRPRTTEVTAVVDEPLAPVAGATTPPLPPAPPASTPPAPAPPAPPPAPALPVDETPALRSRIATLEAEIETLRAHLAEVNFDAAAAHDDRRRAEAALRLLQADLLQAGWYDLAHEPERVDEAPVACPGSFAALVADAAAYAALGVHLSAQERDLTRNAALLDARDPLGGAASNAWEVLLTLADYARAKRERVHTGNLYNYLETPPTGFRSVSLGRFAVNETAATMEAFGADRIFPVPKHVHPDERVTMTAHFRLGQVGGMSAPRLYFFDDTHRSGHVFVGYIGPHLRNTQSN